MFLFVAFMTFWSLAVSHTIPSFAHPFRLDPRQAPNLKSGGWLMTYTPTGSSTVYKGPLRVTSNSSSLYISGDWYNGTVQPNPADGVPILPRANYFAFTRATKLTAGANGGFDLALEAFRFRGIRKIGQNYTDWDDNETPLDGGYTISLSPASSPSGYPDSKQYFKGDLKFTSSGKVAGQFTIGWVSQYIRKITLEIGTVSGLEIPQKDSSGKRTWKSILAEVGWDIQVIVGKTAIPEPTNTDLPAGMWTVQQQHDAMLKYRGATDFDKEWKYYLLVVRRMQGVERGAMMDTGYEFNGIPREGTTVSTDWVFGTLWDGSLDTKYDWGSATGKKFVDVHDAWFRTAVHEVGHFFNLQHPYEFAGGIMDDSQSYVDAGRNGVTKEKFPENIGAEAFRFSNNDRFLMQHRPDLYSRPGFVRFGGAIRPNSASRGSLIRGCEGRHLAACGYALCSACLISLIFLEVLTHMASGCQRSR
ncbi:hypothetical protein BCR34DRAFT_232689 [Clohesyomyces aquaticus]|uniref:Peptidase M43 pregnancy-associated plasma-A domain-containing protein n=1 Tax=Clohesyomyces aquaticus TaxID=1231657 RepID=A0A1Y1ZW74_9PLEO|nr:hypothetical protein BCR34DRAFT_232689 [Clohesyomyces aquaticus]